MLAAWMAQQADKDLFISSLTVAEVWRGLLLEKPAGKKRKGLERWFYGPEGPPALFAGRVLRFYEKSAPRLVAADGPRDSKRATAESLPAGCDRVWPGHGSAYDDYRVLS
jgi:hypothetical protein